MYALLCRHNKSKIDDYFAEQINLQGVFCILMLYVPKGYTDVKIFFFGKKWDGGMRLAVDHEIDL